MIDRLGVRVVLLLGSLITSVAIVSMSFSPTYMRAFGAVLLAGIGAGAVSAASIVMMPLSFFDKNASNHDHLSAALNLGHVFIALGALIMPVLSDVLQRLIGYRRTAGILALVCLTPAFLCVLPPFSTAVVDQEKAFLIQSGFPSPLTQDNGWHLWLAGLVFFFYAPLEGLIGLWTTTSLTVAGYQERGAAWVLTGFWTAFLLGRLATALIPHGPAWDPVLIVVPALLSAVLLGNLSGAGTSGSRTPGLLLLGLLLGPIFPTLVGVVFREFPDARGTSYGIMYAIGATGSLILAPLVGMRFRAILENRNTSHINHNFSLPMGIALLLTFVSTIFVLVVGTGR
jgi:MFS family permease